MSRRIELTRIHAINWYGYRDTIDVRGNLLIAGVTGSGKSVLMDLIQLVLVGDRAARYNQSATGTASTRNLKSYCLADTKQDLDGAPQYMRDRGAITYAALEFTWPDKKRVETWGLRIEYESAAREEANSKKPFYIPGSLGRAAFLTAEKQPLDLASFRRMVHDDDGDVFETMDAYRREMSLPSHLNFDRGTLDYLLPAAMSFTFLRSFNDFCRLYILPSDEVNIEHVKDSYRAFRNLERDLGVLRDQQTRLENIQRIFLEQAAAERDLLVARFLEAEFRREDAVQTLAVLEKECADLTDELATETAELTRLEQEISDTRGKIDNLRTILAESEQGRLFLHLKNQIGKRAADIAKLREISTNVDQAWAARRKATEKWLQLARALSFPVDSKAFTALELGLQRSEAPTGEIKERVKALGLAMQGAHAAVQSGARPIFEQERTYRQEQERLQTSLAALALGTLTENVVLLSALAKLPRTEADAPAQALWQLCEVVDERWRAAIEVAFTRKFAVVVSAENYDRAEQIYHELRDEARGESLVNTQQALSLAASKSAQRGSLAEKIETNHPVARAVVDHAFGDLMCVERREELRKYPRAILPDGFIATRPFVERRRRYDNRPCVGRRGLEKQRAFLQEQFDANSAAQKQLAPALAAIRELSELVRDRRLESESLHDDLAEAARLPTVEKEQAEDIATLAQIRDSGMDEKEAELTRLGNLIVELVPKERALRESQKRGLLASKRKQRDETKRLLEERTERLNKVAAEADVSIYLGRLAEMREEMLTQYPVDVAADKSRDAFHDARASALQLRESLVRERAALAMAHIVFQEFETEATNNDAYQARLEKISASDIPAYQEKAQREQLNWQNLFRSQVLEKLRAALARVDDLINLLNTQLRTEIGNDRYQIHREPNPDHEYKLYRELIAASALAKENELFFASASAEVTEMVDGLFQKLIEQPESREALAFLDYRNYHDYDMWVYDTRDPEAPPSSVDRHSGKFSGGENQSPYFVAILACYLRAYRRYERTRRDPSLALVPIDEAFSKLSGERIRDCIGALQSLDLQGVFSMSSGNIPYAIDMCDQVTTVAKQEKTVGRRTTIRNVAVTMTREEALARLTGQ